MKWRCLGWVLLALYLPLRANGAEMTLTNGASAATPEQLKMTGGDAIRIVASLLMLLGGGTWLIRKRYRRACPRAPAPNAIPVPDRDMQFTVYRPATVPPEVWTPLLVFTHVAELPPDASPDEPDPIEEVQRQASAVLGDKLDIYRQLVQESKHSVPRSGIITIVPIVPGIEFNPPERVFRWEENVHREEFKLRAPKRLDGQVASGGLFIYYGSIVLAAVTLHLRITSAAIAQSRPAFHREKARRFRKIFASYSHQDAQVVDQFEEFSKAVGDEFLRDVSKLRVGEVWSERLEQMISGAEVFQLFWSRHSMRSPFVEREWRYALGLQRAQFVLPVYWENPLPEDPEQDLPPDELRRLHFQRLGFVTLHGQSHEIRDGSLSSSPTHVQHTVPASAINPQRKTTKQSSQKFIARNRAPRVQIEYDLETYGSQKKVKLPFVMGVMADLSGMPTEALPTVSDRKFLEIDVDNFDDRLKSCKPRVAFQLPDTLTGEGNLDVEMTFESMDDFSPATVARKVESLNKLLQARTELANLLTYIDGKPNAEELVGRFLNNWELMKSLVSATNPEVSQELPSKRPETSEEQEARYRVSYRLRPHYELEGSVNSLELVSKLPVREDPKQLPVLDENVQFTVYRPSIIVPNKWYPLLAFAHLSERSKQAGLDQPDPVQEVKRQAETILNGMTEEFPPMTQDSLQAVPREGGLTMIPQIPGIEFNPPTQTFRWLESVHRQDFRLRASPELDGKTAKGKLSVFLGNLILAEVNLSIRVDSGYPREIAAANFQIDPMRRYRNIFASYSHKDTTIVEQVERYAHMLGDVYLRDVTSLRTGEVWSDRLCRMIDEADILQLFWSWNSLDSPFVRKEWEYALSLNRPGFIRPVFWEDPLPCCPERQLPPSELIDLHFQRISPVIILPQGGPNRAEATESLPEKVVEPRIEPNDFEALLNKECKARDTQKQAAVQSAVRTLAQQALASTQLVSADVTKSISAMVSEIDKKMSEQINLIMHHEDFKALEGTWRGLHYLVNNTETDEMLKIRILNLSKKELGSCLQKFKGSAWDQSPLFKRIYEDEFGMPGGQPFGCLVGDYYFDHSPSDVGTLAGMAQLSAAAHTPFISGAGSRLMGKESWQELSQPRDLTKILQSAEYASWHLLRKSEDSRFIGLTLPRFLSRPPYGAKTVPVEEFAFEEDTGGADNNKCIWSNAAYAMGVNIARSFKLYGWCARIRGVESGGMVEGLPAGVFPTDVGAVDPKRPTEIGFDDRREMELAECGLIPLLHVKNSDRAVFITAQSLHKPEIYDDPSATANAALCSRLPNLFAACRFAIYLKCMVRDKLGGFRSEADIVTWINKWLSQYVCPDPSAGAEMKARFPLARAELTLREMGGDTGYFIGHLFIHPHYQLEGLSAPLRVPIVFPSVKPVAGARLPIARPASPIAVEETYNEQRHGQTHRKQPLEPVPFQLLDTLPIAHGDRTSRISLYSGSLVDIPPSETVDMIVVSSFPDSYWPTEGSVIGDLHHKGISVEELSKRKAVDLRQAFSCWLSEEINCQSQGVQFKRILCFEPLVRGKPTELVGEIFQSLMPFVNGEPPIRRIAMPLVACGSQGVGVSEMLEPLVDAAVHWMQLGLPVEELKIVERSQEKITEMRQAFQKLKQRHLAVGRPVRKAFDYHIFLSYSRQNSAAVRFISTELNRLRPDLRIFLDQNEIDIGAAWQQKIFDALESCRWVVTLYSPDFLMSKVCKEEFNIAWCRQRESAVDVLLPIYLYSAELPPHMKVVQFIDCREGDEGRLAAACREILSKTMA